MRGSGRLGRPLASLRFRGAGGSPGPPVWIAVLLLSTSALAAHPGRAAAAVGWRLAPQNHFNASATAAGHPPTRASPGGPALVGTFSYAANDWVAVAVDLFISGERLHLAGLAPTNVYVYGATVGARFFFLEGALHPDLGLHAGLSLGPTLVYVVSDSFVPVESVTQTYTGVAGFTWKVADALALGLDYRLSLVRGHFPDIGGVNAGGSQVTFALTWFFAAESSFR